MNADSTKDAGAAKGVASQNNWPGYDYQSGWEGDPNETPWTVYFYYDKRTADGHGSLEVYEVREDHEISEQELKTVLIPWLTNNARGSKRHPPVSGNDVMDVHWTRKSYIVFALDTGEVYDETDALQITRDPGNGPNHSFFDGGVDEIEIEDNDPIQAVWTVNYRKNEHGRDLGKKDKHDFILTFGIKGRTRRHPPIVDGGDHGQNDGGSTAPPPGAPLGHEHH
jgi:hypothetical protein